MATFVTITPEEMTEDVFTAIGKEWMLIAVGDEDKHNMMTASWGGFGVLWNKKVSTIYVRPSRYTYDFLENGKTYALCFFDEAHRDKLTYCGRHSGRDGDKCAATGLTPCFDKAAPYFEEASMVVFCNTLYKQDMDPACFLDPAIEGNYNGADYHRMYIGEITEVMKK